MPQMQIRVGAIRDRLVGERALVDKEQAELAQIKDTLTFLREEEVVLEGSEGALMVLSTKVLSVSLDKVDKLVTTALGLVFQDQKLQFESRLEKSRGRTSMEFILTQDGQEAPLNGGYGGGVLCVIGVLLRVLTIMILGARRVLVLDESLSMLSSEYVAPCSAFLRKLAAELGFKILMISHEEEFATHADQHLRAEEVGGLLKMTVVFG